MTSLALPLPGRPVDVDIADVRKQQSGASVISLCASKAGKLDKVVAADLDIQEAVWSRVKSGTNSLSLESLDLLMTTCGNEAPMHWLLLRRGYDPRSLRRIETDVEIVAKKMWHRGDQVTARDLFDLALVIQIDRQGLAREAKWLVRHREAFLSQIARRRQTVKITFDAINRLPNPRVVIPNYDDCTDMATEFLTRL